MDTPKIDETFEDEASIIDKQDADYKYVKKRRDYYKNKLDKMGEIELNPEIKRDFLGKKRLIQPIDAAKNKLKGILPKFESDFDSITDIDDFNEIIGKFEDHFDSLEFRLNQDFHFKEEKTKDFQGFKTVEGSSESLIGVAIEIYIKDPIVSFMRKYPILSYSFIAIIFLGSILGIVYGTKKSSKSPKNNKKNKLTKQNKEKNK